MNTSYNRVTNKFTYDRTYSQTTNYYNMYIEIIIAVTFWDYLTMLNIQLIFSATDCIYPINTMTIKTLCVGVSGDISFKFNHM
jgi:hypothetical protein